MSKLITNHIHPDTLRAIDQPEQHSFLVPGMPPGVLVVRYGTVAKGEFYVAGGKIYCAKVWDGPTVGTPDFGEQFVVKPAHGFEFVPKDLTAGYDFIVSEVFTSPRDITVTLTVHTADQKARAERIIQALAEIDDLTWVSERPINA